MNMHVFMTRESWSSYLRMLWSFVHFLETWINFTLINYMVYLNKLGVKICPRRVSLTGSAGSQGHEKRRTSIEEMGVSA